MTTKTIKEWLNGIDNETVKDLAFKNLYAQNPVFIQDILNLGAFSIGQAIAMSFTWERTPEGQKFWEIQAGSINA